jgi:type IV pilus assembly protein PilY1
VVGINTESGNTNNYGERQVSNMIVRNGRLIFTTLVPSDDPCDFGGSGWLMEVDVNTGARLSFSPFDLDSNSTFDINDMVNAGDLDGDGFDDYVPVSGKKSNVGIIPTPSITENLNDNTEYKYKSGSTGSIELTVENPGARPNGRQSWRQLF